MSQPSDSRRRALVTGGTGFVGWHLVKRLASEGWDVDVIARRGSEVTRLEFSGAPVTIHRHDGSTEGMVKILEQARPTVAFHLASLFLASHETKDVAPLIHSNILLGTQLVEGMVRAGVRFLVNTGTSWQHAQDGSYQPVCLYAATKQAFEDIAQYYADAHELRVLTLKLFDTYGPRDPRKKLFNLLRGASDTGQALMLSPGEQLIDLVYIDDVVDVFVSGTAYLFKGIDPAVGSYAVSSGNPVSLRSIVDTYCSVTGREIDVQWGGRPYRDREVMVPWETGVVLPGWSPKVNLVEGIRRLAASYDKQV